MWPGYTHLADERPGQLDHRHGHPQGGAQLAEADSVDADPLAGTFGGILSREIRYTAFGAQHPRPCFEVNQQEQMDIPA